MDNKIIVVTTPNLEGYKILEYIDLIYDEVCFSQNVISEFKNLVSDKISYVVSFFADTELSGTSAAIMKAKEYIIEKIKEKARNIGANAIVGIDFETSFGTSKTCIRVSVSGTAVKVIKLEELEKHQKELEEKKQQEQLAKKEKEEKINSLRDKHKNEKSFIYENHENDIMQLSSLNELIDYLDRLEIDDDYFNTTVMPAMKEFIDLERLYGSMLKSAISKLKELTTTV